jgi:hypothetical protein
MQKIRSAVQEATPVGKTGTAKKSWTIVERDSTGYSFGNSAPYSHVLEAGSPLGGRPWASSGPKTVTEDGRVYSSQAPGGITKKANIDTILEDALKDFEGLFN